MDEPRKAIKNLPFSCGGDQWAVNLWKAGNVTAYKIDEIFNWNTVNIDTILQKIFRLIHGL